MLNRLHGQPESYDKKYYSPSPGPWSIIDTNIRS
jgi:hypothetical protein